MSHVDRCVCVTADGFISAGQAVSVGGGADYVRAAAAQPGEDEGNQENLQVCHSLASDGYFLTIGTKRQKLLWTYYKKDLLGTHSFTGKKYK